MNVGIIGCGHISTAHLKAWESVPGSKICGVFDVKRELAEKRSREFQVPVLDSPDALIAQCDVVDVCTPPQTHPAIAEQVIRAGRHLLIEKPIVIDVQDWEKILQLVEHSPGTITVVHNIKFAAGIQRAKQWLDQGKLGTVLSLRREFLTSPRHDRMLVSAAHTSNGHTGNSHWSHNLPGGRWFETLPHELYLIHYFAGPLELADVTALHTDSAPDSVRADEVLITLKNDQCTATIQFSANCEQNRRVFSIQGSEARVEFDVLADAVSLSRARDSLLKRGLGGGVMLNAAHALAQWLPDRAGYGMRRLRNETPHTRLIRAFAAYLDGKGPEPTPLAEIDYVVRNCDRIGREIDRQVGRL